MRVGRTCARAATGFSPSVVVPVRYMHTGRGPKKLVRNLKKSDHQASQVAKGIFNTTCRVERNFKILQAGLVIGVGLGGGTVALRMALDF